jgi:hypothetical protein
MPSRRIQSSLGAMRRERFASKSVTHLASGTLCVAKGARGA